LQNGGRGKKEKKREKKVKDGIALKKKQKSDPRGVRSREEASAAQ